jgi:hypothetical protein
MPEALRVGEKGTLLLGSQAAQITNADVRSTCDGVWFARDGDWLACDGAWRACDGSWLASEGAMLACDGALAKPLAGSNH